jgi:hypothetical protein
MEKNIGEKYVRADITLIPLHATDIIFLRILLPLSLLMRKYDAI